MGLPKSQDCFRPFYFWSHMFMHFNMELSYVWFQLTYFFVFVKFKFKKNLTEKLYLAKGFEII